MSKASDTRLAILQKAFELIYMHGYQTTSIDEIIATTKVTKGAFFYHFKNKDEMGLAVINEVMLPGLDSAMVQPLINSADPVNDIYAIIESLLLQNPFLQVRYGCPAGNLTQEMAGANEAFRQAINTLTIKWQEMIYASIEAGKSAARIRTDVDPQRVGYFVMSGYWGIRHFGKLTNSNECYHVFLKELKTYLSSLK